MVSRRDRPDSEAFLVQFRMVRDSGAPLQRLAAIEGTWHRGSDGRVHHADHRFDLQLVAESGTLLDFLDQRICSVKVCDRLDAFFGEAVWEASIATAAFVAVWQELALSYGSELSPVSPHAAHWVSAQRRFRLLNPWRHLERLEPHITQQYADWLSFLDAQMDAHNSKLEHFYNSEQHKYLLIADGVDRALTDGLRLFDELNHALIPSSSPDPHRFTGYVHSHAIVDPVNLHTDLAELAHRVARLEPLTASQLAGVVPLDVEPSESLWQLNVRSWRNHVLALISALPAQLATARAVLDADDSVSLVAVPHYAADREALLAPLRPFLWRPGASVALMPRLAASAFSQRLYQVCDPSLDLLSPEVLELCEVLFNDTLATRQDHALSEIWQTALRLRA